MSKATATTWLSEIVRCEWFTGYRNDYLHWHLQDGGAGILNYSEIGRDLQFWENGLTLKTLYRDCFFLLRGSYAAFGKGKGFQRYDHLDFTSDSPQFHFDTKGWASDVLGYFGLAVNLTADRTYKVAFIPLIGGSGHFEYIHRGHVEPNPLESTNGEGASFFTMNSFQPKKLHSTWYGFFVGGDFLIEPGGQMIFSGGYHYHWLHLRFKGQYGDLVSLWDPSLLSSEENLFDFQAKGGGNRGHTGWGQIDYAASVFWRVGLGAEIHYFFSTLLETTLHERQKMLFPIESYNVIDQSQKLKVRWTSISGWLMLSRAF